KMDGHIYGIPNYQTVTKREGFIILKEMADKYDLDVDSIKTMADITPFLEKIKANEPDMIPIAMGAGGVIIGHAFGTDDIQSGVGIQWNGDDPYKAQINIGGPE